MRLSFAALCASIVLAIIVACGGGGGGNNNPPSPPTLNYTATFTGVAGASFADTSLKANAGDNAKTTLRLTTNYTKPVVTASDRTTPVSISDTSDAMVKNVVVGPMRGDCTFTAAVTPPRSVSFKLAAGIHTATNPLTVSDGVPTPATFTIDPGLTSLTATVETGGNATASVTNLTVTVTASSDCSIDISAAAQTFPVTIVAGPGTTASTNSIDVPYGQTGSVNVGLLPGYQNLTASGPNVSINNGVCTFGPITASTTVTLSATLIPTWTITFGQPDGGEIMSYDCTQVLSGKQVTLQQGQTIEIVLAPHNGRAPGVFTSSDIAFGNGCYRTGFTSYIIQANKDCSVTGQFPVFDLNGNSVPDDVDAQLTIQNMDAAPRAFTNSDIAAGKKSITYTLRAFGTTGKRYLDNTAATVDHYVIRTQFTGVGTPSPDNTVDIVPLAPTGNPGEYSATITPTGYRKIDSWVLSSDEQNKMFKGNAYAVDNQFFAVDASGAFLQPSNAVFGNDVQTMVLADTVPQAPLVKLNPTTYRSDRFLVLITQEYENRDDDKWIGRMSAPYTGTAYDFGMKIPFSPSFIDNWTHFRIARMDATGLGFDPSDDSPSYGIPGLRGIVQLGLPSLDGNAVPHELGHHNAAYLAADPLNLTFDGVHFNTAEVEVGQMQVGPLMQWNGTQWNVIPVRHLYYMRPYGPLELYLFGLEFPKNVPAMNFAIDWCTNIDPNVVDPKYVKNVTIDAIIAQYGARTPAYDGSTQHWKMFTTVVSPRPLTQDEANYLDLMLRHVEGNDDFEGDTTASVSVVASGRVVMTTLLDPVPTQSAARASALTIKTVGVHELPPPHDESKTRVISCDLNRKSPRQ